MSEPNVEVTNSPPGEILFEEPYARLLPEYMALTAEELVPVNLDIGTSVTTVLGARPEILALAPRFVKELPEFNLEKVKKLDEYAMGLAHAHTLFMMASQPPDSLVPLVEEGTKLRETLLADATALVQRGHLNGNRLKELKGINGHKNLAFDLHILATLFRDSFTQVSSKSDVKEEELLRAQQIAARIFNAVGLREQGPALIAAAADVRIRAFTLLTRYYDQARRAVSYLRWDEDDAGTIAPSLFLGRGGRKRPSTDNPPVVVVPEGPVPATGSPATGAVPTQPAPGTASTPNVPGTPGAHPFLT